MRTISKIYSILCKFDEDEVVTNSDQYMRVRKYDIRCDIVNYIWGLKIC